MLKIKKVYNHKVVTSGYADRFIMSGDEHYTVEQSAGSEHFKMEFRYENDLRGYLMAMCGMTFDRAWSAVAEAEVVHYISGEYPSKIAGCGWQWTQLTISAEELHSVSTYVSLISCDNLTREARQERVKFLQAHPLGERLQNVVDAQLADCDRKNELHWGHKDGQAHRE